MIPSPDHLPLFSALGPHGGHGGAGAAVRSKSHAVSGGSEHREAPGLRKAEHRNDAEEPRWPAGRLVELTGRGATARTSLVVHQLVRHQAEGELVAWVQPRGGTFYPPDAAEAGVDLDALTIVHVPPSAIEAARAAELLLRSGAFGLVVVDLEGMSQEQRLPTRALARLHALCRRHDAVVAFLAPPAPEALGSLVSLRLAPKRQPLGEVWQIESEALRDKEHLGASMRHVKRKGPRGASAADERSLSRRQGVLLQLRQTLPLPFESEESEAGAASRPRALGAASKSTEVRDVG